MDAATPDRDESLSRRLDDVLQQVQASLRTLAALGVRGFDPPRSAMALLDGWGRPAPAKVPVPGSLAAIRADLGDCQRCRLARGRTHIVFGSGPPDARIAFVGEGPGQEEDLRGEPFVGAAGQLLTRMIAAMGLTREQVYIANVVKCRPPGNRTPERDEIEPCAPFLQRQLAAIRPDFIVALGAVAAQTLLASSQPLRRLRGRLHDRGGSRVLATYHPAYLLRSPERKRDAWSDLQRVIAAAGLKPGAAPAAAPARQGLAPKLPVDSKEL
jgi:DNA polymerase